MNRHERRTARRLQGCLAGYRADPEAPPIHTPEACDGTCHTRPVDPAAAPPRRKRRRDDEPPVRIALDGQGGIKVIYAAWFYLAQEVAPPSPGADFGLSREMYRTLALMARRDLAEERARGLAPLLGALLAVRTLAAARVKLLAELFSIAAAPGVIGRRRADRWLEVCPHTGPPRVVARPEAPVMIGP